MISPLQRMAACRAMRVIFLAAVGPVINSAFTGWRGNKMGDSPGG